MAIVTKQTIHRLYTGYNTIEHITFECIEDLLVYKKRFDLLRVLNEINSFRAKAGATDTFYHFERRLLSKLTHDDQLLINQESFGIDEIKTNSFTHSQILMILYLHFCNMDSRGIVKAFNVNHCANAINVSKRTILNNIKTLSENGIFYFTEIQQDVFSCMMKDHNVMTRSEEKGKSPYIKLSKKLFTKLVETDGVAALRLNLRKILSSDNGYTKDNKTSYNIQTLKRYVPRYLRSLSSLVKLSSKSTDAFDQTFNKEKGLNFKLKDEYDFKRSEDQFELLTWDKLSSNLNGLPIDKNNYRDDLIQMTIQYGQYHVLKTIKSIKNKYQIDNNFNLCGLIRRIIDQDLVSIISAA